jgi:hypothetical protein
MVPVMAVRPSAMSPARPSKMPAIVVVLHAVMMAVMIPAMLCFCGAAGRGNCEADSYNSGESDE